MKNLIRAFLLIACVFLLNSFVSAEHANPAFKITIQDSGGPYAYQWSYAVENTDGTMGLPLDHGFKPIYQVV
jgi:negative regulator of sigma E activity